MKNYKNMDLIELIKERERIIKELEEVQKPDYIKQKTADIFAGKLDNIEEKAAAAVAETIKEFL